MSTASHRVILIYNGRKSVRRTVLVDCEDASEAVSCALKWTVWSHGKGRPRTLPRYNAFRVEERHDKTWNLIREGTYEDAAQEFCEEVSPTPEVGTVSQLEVFGYEGRRSARARARGGSDRGTSRLANLVNRTLKDR